MNMAAVPSAPSAATASTGGPSAPPAALKISDFQVLSKLGEGGFGTVLLAKKKSSGKLYALKVLEKRNMRMRGIAERVIAECETLQRIHHPFVVQMHYAFQDRSRVVFVLEHVAGGDLFTYLQERQAFPESWCQTGSSSRCRILWNDLDMAFSTVSSSVARAGFSRRTSLRVKVTRSSTAVCTNHRSVLRRLTNHRSVLRRLTDQRSEISITCTSCILGVSCRCTSTTLGGQEASTEVTLEAVLIPDEVIYDI